MGGNTDLQVTIENPPPPSAPEPQPTDFNKGADYWYYTLGCNVVPVVTKYKTGKKGYKWKIFRPLKSIPEDLFEKWKSENAFAEGIAVVAGKSWRGAHEGEYLIFYKS